MTIQIVKKGANMANSKFTRFNKNSRIFDIDGLPFRQEKNKYGETVNKYYTSETLFEEDGSTSVPHQVVAIYRNNFSEEFLREYPDMPDHRYNVAIKMGEDDYAYVSAPAGMNEQFAVQGLHTAAIAGIIAVGILLASTMARIYFTWISRRKK